MLLQAYTTNLRFTTGQGRRRCLIIMHMAISMLKFNAQEAVRMMLYDMSNLLLACNL